MLEGVSQGSGRGQQASRRVLNSYQAEVDWQQRCFEVMFSAADSMAPKKVGRSLLMAALVAMRVDDGRLPVEHIHKSSSPGRGSRVARCRSTS